MTATLETMFAQLPSHDTAVRRWSFEAEHPAIAGTAHGTNWATRRPFTFVVDGSVDTDYDYCECSCRECHYHECNCDNCEDYNDDPSHCGDADCCPNELCPSDPIATAWNPELNAFLAQALTDAEDFEGNYPDRSRMGGHVHVEARDLTKAEARLVAVIGQRMFTIAPEWFTGGEDDYNNRVQGEQLQKWVQDLPGWNYPERGSIVSVYNVAGQIEPRPYSIGDGFDHRKTTIEFRGFRTTFDAQIIAVRGAVCRAIVGFVKSLADSGLSPYWATREQSFEEFLGVIGFGKH